MPNMNGLLDALRQKHELKSDAALARRLKLAPSDICKARKTNVMTSRMIVHISEQLKLPIAAIRELAT